MNLQKLEFSRRAKRREREREDDEAGVMDEFASLIFQQEERGEREDDDAGVMDEFAKA
jgi:hypothetical protein